MTMMNYNKFKQILNETIFEKSKADLLTKIANSPSRYIGLFRPTKPKAKLLQNLLQSHEIRFGDAFEIIIEEYLRIIGYEILPKTLKYDDDYLNVDQCFKKNKMIYFIEQKVRDDHDSTKKRGQIENFEKKLSRLLKIYGENIIGIFYFLDPELKKNKNYYEKELLKINKDYNVETFLFYGQDLFNYLDYKNIWSEIIRYLEKWKKEIPELPEINFDLDAKHTFEEIKDLDTLVFRKLFTDDIIFQEILLTLFPENKTLKLLYEYFLTKDLTIYKNLANILSKRIMY
ncbi:MAG TPA: hypothetical protein PK891_00055 [Bacteroidales bacterium]|nr:hypothetical protein [Bacteroidales bacterium]HNW20654.1 hypothetical protein [Bacteroidales bacterium]HOF07990.1 hypothetical protein [Bacteroidales bacterium]HOH93281.1 hypothetical protein [Bacteroidales bacterium]HOY90089.1 hypothetical protein [Bacteroidales bacterium]